MSDGRGHTQNILADKGMELSVTLGAGRWTLRHRNCVSAVGGSPVELIEKRLFVPGASMFGSECSQLQRTERKNHI